MKNIIDFSKTRLKALQRFRKGKGPWGVYHGHFFVMNPNRTAICFIRPREFDAFKGANVNFSPWAAPLDIGNYEANLETGEIIDTIKGEAVDIESKPLTSQSLDYYLHPWNHDFGKGDPWCAVACGTLKLAAQTFEAFGIKRITCENYPSFQYWSGQNNDMAVMIVTMGMR